MVANGSIADRLLPNSIEHAINLEPNTKPPFRLLYNLSNCKLEVLREYLERAQANG